LLSAVTHHLRTTIKSVPIAEKSNEIPAIKPLLEGLPLEGSLITADAMHCQQETTRFITQDLGADYLIGLKGNQSGILERAECKLSPVFFSS
jgi:predicted transposase YbfD/YdcC